MDKGKPLKPKSASKDKAAKNKSAASETLGAKSAADAAKGAKKK